MAGIEVGRRKVSVLAALAAVLTLSGGTALAEPPAPSAAPRNDSEWTASQLAAAVPSYGSTKQLAIKLPMSDGVELTIDVSYPSDPKTGEIAQGRFPVLLTQTPYLNFSPSAGDYFVERGYIYVTAYVRGTTRSEGDFGFFSSRDAKDGAELVRWVARNLPASSGVVGLHGGSYMGITQVFTLLELGKDSPVRALNASCMGAEFYRETYFAGGVPTQTLNFQRIIQGAMGRGTGPIGAQIVKDIEAGGEKSYFGTFWKSRTLGDFVQQIVATGVPILLWSSDGDIYTQSSLDLYAYLQNAGAGRPPYGLMDKATSPSAKYQIFMGQGGHCADIDERVQLEWFDAWLKGKSSDMISTKSPIHVHELGSDRWINAARFPEPEIYTRYYLTSRGTLSPTRARQRTRATVEWAQPAPSSWIAFETPAFGRPVTLAGTIGASFLASSTTRNLMLIASVELVEANGTVRKLGSGEVLGSMSETDPTRSWLAVNGGVLRPYGTYDANRFVPAGTRQSYNFAISPRFAAIPTGSRLRLIVTTQTPADKCGPPLGTDPCFPTAPQLATLEGGEFSLYFGDDQGSYLNIPLKPADQNQK